MIIRIDILSPLENTLLWVASFYVLYITKGAAAEIPGFRQVNHFLNMALIGSFFLLSSVFIATGSASAEPTTKPFLNQLSLSTLTVGFTISFIGSSLALFTIMRQNKGLLRLFLLYFFGLLMPIEVWALTHWVAYPFNITSYLGLAWRGAFIELQLFYLSYPFILWLSIALLFSWIWVPLVRFVKDRIVDKQMIHIRASLFGSHSDIELRDEVSRERLSGRKNHTNPDSSSARLVSAVILLSLLFLGGFIAYYPYINPKPGLVGTDSLGYYNSLNAIADKGFCDAVRLATEINIARVPYHLLLYFLKSLTQLSSNTVIAFMPIITILANTLALFWFVKIGERKALVASMAAVFSIFSFTTTIAMHAGILANWLAMALGFTMFGVILKLQEKMNLKLVFAAILTLSSVFLIHYWSGVFFLMVLGCYTFLMLFERRRRSTKSVVAMVLLALAILIAFFSSGLASHFFLSYGLEESVGPMEVFVAFWTKLPIFIDSWFFGALANPVVMALALIGMVVCFYQRTNFSRLLISWVVVGSLLSVFVSPIGRNMNQWLMWRTLYLIPFQIPAALGLFFLVEKLGSLRQNKSRFQFLDYVQRSNPSPNFPERENLRVVFYLIIDYVVSAVLLTLDFPILVALVFFNYLVLTLIVHFKIQKRDNNSVLMFIFAMFVTLLLFNYALRSLAPLTVYRMQT